MPDWPLVMTENLSGGKFVGSVGELPAFKHALHSEADLPSALLSAFRVCPVSSG